MENHKAYMSRFIAGTSGSDLERLEFAYQLAKCAHGKQLRDDGETRYFEHLRATSLIVFDELDIYDVDIHIAILLHDIVEDSYLLSWYRIVLNFGMKVFYIVEKVTKPDVDGVKFQTKEGRDIFYFSEMLHWSFDELLVKCADRLHNMRTLSECSPEKQARKIDETKKYFRPVLRRLRNHHRVVGNFFEREFKKVIPDF